MALTLVRHTTPAVMPGTCYGMTDLPLADSFDDECATVLETLPRHGAVLTSPLSRCHRLARAIADHWTVPLTVSVSWREMDFGAWEGVAWDAVPRDGLDAWAADFHGYDGHGGESVGALETRIRAALSAAQPDTLIVTHSGPIRAAMAIWGQGDGWDTKTGFGRWVSGP